MSHMSELNIDQQNEQGHKAPKGAKGEPGPVGAHHPLGPSALKYIEICPGFRNSGETSPAAAEGTMLHAAVEKEDLKGLDDEQVKQCETVLRYVKNLRLEASEVIKEEKLVIRYA